jgi:HlyD family secretion protein
MKTLRLKNLWWLGLALMLGLVLRFLLRPSGMVAGEKEARRATRELVDKSGTGERLERPDGEWIAGNGIIEPRGEELKLAASVPGRVAQLHVKEGDWVEAGALLGRLDDEVQRAAVASAEAEVRVATAELSLIRAGQRREDVEAITAESAASRARAEQAAREAARQARLKNASVNSENETERAETERDLQQAVAAAAAARARAAQAGARTEDIAIVEARLASAQARLVRAQAEAALQLIRAPAAGRVLQIKFRPGEYYTPNSPARQDPLFLLGDTRALQARLDIDERDANRLSVGQQGYVTMLSASGQRWSGRVIELGQRMGRRNLRTDDPTERIDTKIREVVIELESAEGLIPGQRVYGYVQPTAK